METIKVKDRAEWRGWLAENHDRVKEIWLVYFKKETGEVSLSYQESLDEALCYGWVDSLIKKLDESRYVRKFTPRKENSKWSQVNKKRVEELTSAGLMTEHGLNKVQAAKRSGNWDHPVQKPAMEVEMPLEFNEALKDNPQAEETFKSLTASHQKEYLLWIVMAKKPETRRKRIEESVRTLKAGKKLGLK